MLKEKVATLYTVHIDEANVYRTFDVEDAQELSEDGHRVTAETFSYMDRI